MTAAGEGGIYTSRAGRRNWLGGKEGRWLVCPGPSCWLEVVDGACMWNAPAVVEGTSCIVSSGENSLCQRMYVYRHPRPSPSLLAWLNERLPLYPSGEEFASYLPAAAQVYSPAKTSSLASFAIVCTKVLHFGYQRHGRPRCQIRFSLDLGSVAMAAHVHDDGSSAGGR